MIAFNAVTPAISDAAAGFSDPLVWVGSPSRQLLLAVFGFEGVAAGSGPYIQYDPSGVHGTTPTGGWARVLFEPPSATGNALEVWAAYWGAGPSTRFLFTGTYDYVARGLMYTGQYDTGTLYAAGNGTVRAFAKDQVSGDDPACPAIYAFVDEMLVALASDQLQSPGFGTPTPAGWSSRFDSERGGSFGNVEITAADKLTTAEGDTGPIPFDAVAAAAGTKGATATLAIRPASSSHFPPPTPPPATSPRIAFEYAVAL